jgi:radical SAM-linked protein
VARTPDGPPPEPAVQKLRLRYAKRGRLRFTSHRDFQRAFERALRRADVPMAYSAGFSPHPKVSYAGAAPTGSASEAEYLEISLTQRCDPEAVRAALDAALPPGLDLLEAVEAPPGALADRLEASVWRVRLPGVPVGAAGPAVARFLAQDHVEVERLTKNGRRSFDARAAVLALEVEPADAGNVDGAPVEVAEPACAILQMVVRHATPAVRPDDVLAGLRRVADLVPPAPPEVTRLAQGPFDGRSGRVSDPLHEAGPLAGGDAVGA